jgi:tRNA (guanine37-N1)-methyltransferase
MESLKTPEICRPVLSVITLFPEAVRAVVDSSILRRAQTKGLLQIEVSDLRQFSTDRYRSVDDTPFGGEQGMLLTAPVLHAALNQELVKAGGDRENLRVLYPSPRGLILGQRVFEELSSWLVSTGTPEPSTSLDSMAGSPKRVDDKGSSAESARRVVVICGRYEGIDDRVVDRWVDLEFSVGDFILTGGELPALMVIDALVRLVPGVLGDSQSARQDSFSSGLLEHPQYTKPRDFEGQGVPDELVSGDHAKMAEWKLRESLLLSYAFRPDLIRRHQGQGLPSWAMDLLDRLKKRLDLRS